MAQTLTIAMISFALLFAALLFHRVRQLGLESHIETLREEWQ